jgi:ABC-type nitrate/sulfonate/bicarbonate transport system permease component
MARLSGALARGIIRWLTRSGSLLVLLIAWLLAAAAGLFSPYLLPAPVAVLARLAEDARSGALGQQMLITFSHALAGFAIAAALGTALGIVMVRLRPARWFFDPIVSLGFPMPKIAFLPIVLLWLGPGGGTDIAIVAASSLFPITGAAAAGAEGVDKTLLWSAESLGTGRAALLWRIVLPAAVPQIVTGLQIGLPIALITEIVAEMMLGSDGLGGAMLQSMRFADSPGVFSGIVAIGVLGYAAVWAMEVLRGRLLRWHPEADKPSMT